MVGCSQGFGTWWATGISCSEWAETWFNLWDGLKQPTCSEMYDIICDYVILCIHDICLQSYYIMFSYIIIYIIFNLHIYIYIHFLVPWFRIPLGFDGRPRQRHRVDACSCHQSCDLRSCLSGGVSSSGSMLVDAGTPGTLVSIWNWIAYDTSWLVDIYIYIYIWHWIYKYMD